MPAAIKPLRPPDTHHLRAAEGWLELGNTKEALRELAQLSAPHREHPDALDVLWQIHAKEKQWAKCVGIADRIVQTDPHRDTGWVHRSFALHELKRTQEAHDQLLPALANFTDSWLVPYNLACYLCQLGRLDESRRLLAKAIKRGGPTVRQTALQDGDLQPLHAGQALPE